MVNKHTNKIQNLILQSRDLEDQKKYQEQLSVLNTLHHMDPENDDYLSELALCLIRTGDTETAAAHLIRLVLSTAKNLAQLKALMVTALSISPIRQYNADCKSAIRLSLQNQYDCDTQPLFFSWLIQVMHAPETEVLKEPVYHLDSSGFDHWMDNIGEEERIALADEFLLLGMGALILAEPLIEFFLTRLRRYLSLHFCRLQQASTIHVFRPILFALAHQCFINEYVFLAQDDEIEATYKLRSMDKPLSEEAVALLACYGPVTDSFSSRELDSLLSECHKKSTLYQLLKTQYLDLIKEKQLQEAIESFALVKDPVSVEVRAQYEQNPYPRWLSIASSPGPLDDIVKDYQPETVLVAGCGTGQHAISAAARYPKAKILAIDLSKTSLGYAARKAREAGSAASHIEFLQADILSMQAWKEQFDIIESCGVLHHMADPKAGIGALVDRLTPGGYFKLGLYSRAARAPLNLARDYVEEKELSSDPDTIRWVRYVLLNQPADSDVYRFFVNSVDFYTTSRVRDAIFNVQEHQFDLFEIQQILEKFGLEFVRFTLNRAYIYQAFKNRFPEDPGQTNLSNWHKLETDHPRLFSGMYQFWVQKTTAT